MLTFIVITIIAKTFGVSLRSYEANVAAISLAFISYGTIAFSLFRFRPRVLGIALGCVASLPIVAGLFLGTVGVFFVLFAARDSVPIHTSFTKGGLSCYVTRFGNATTSDGGYVVVLTKSFPVLSLLEYKVQKQTFNAPDFPSTDACDKAVYDNGTSSSSRSL